MNSKNKGYVKYFYYGTPVDDIDQLVNFLKANKCLVSYIRNFNAYKVKGKYLSDHLRVLPKNLWIIGVFNVIRTKEGFMFWMLIHRKWEKEIGL